MAGWEDADARNGWEYAAVPVDAVDTTGARWFRKNAEGVVTIAGLDARTEYRLVARIRAFDEFDVPDVTYKKYEAIETTSFIFDIAS